MPLIISQECLIILDMSKATYWTIRSLVPPARKYTPITFSSVILSLPSVFKLFVSAWLNLNVLCHLHLHRHHQFHCKSLAHHDPELIKRERKALFHIETKSSNALEDSFLATFPIFGDIQIHHGTCNPWCWGPHEFGGPNSERINMEGLYLLPSSVLLPGLESLLGVPPLPEFQVNKWYK